MRRRVIGWRSTSTPEPTSSYFICGTPRSGTTLLAGLLASSGLVGRAAEHFSPGGQPEWTAADYGRYLRHCVEQTTVNRVFGAKLLWDELEHLLARLRTLRGRGGSNDRVLLESVFPSPRFMWLTREDVLAQAVSWSKAAQTGEFYVGDPRANGVAPVFDERQIRLLVDELAAKNESWRHWFDANDIEPFSIRFEDLKADPDGRAREALEFLGLKVPPGLELTASTVQQADAVNREWIARMRVGRRPRSRMSSWLRLPP
jgi:LPS sulfotransferase NodH